MELSWWNLIPTYFDGTAFQLGNFPVRWYGIMYIFAFVTAYITMWKISQKEKLGYTKHLHVDYRGHFARRTPRLCVLLQSKLLSCKPD